MTTPIKYMTGKYMIGLAGLLLSSQVNAQIYLKPIDLSGPVLLVPEPGYGVALPNATAAELKAAMVWNMRSGLNVAALQCGFEPALRTLENYNALLTNHRDELQATFTTLSGYFRRTSKTLKAGQNALDVYGTRTYSAFSAVSGQLNFCTAAGRVSTSAMFAPRGRLATVAQERIRELYNGVKSRAGEQQFGRAVVNGTLLFPNFDQRCWKKSKYVAACGMRPFF